MSELLRYLIDNAANRPGRLSIRPVRHRYEVRFFASPTPFSSSRPKKEETQGPALPQGRGKARIAERSEITLKRRDNGYSLFVAFLCRKGKRTTHLPALLGKLFKKKKKGSWANRRAGRDPANLVAFTCILRRCGNKAVGFGCVSSAERTVSQLRKKGEKKKKRLRDTDSFAGRTKIRESLCSS